jgi:Fic family protein
LDNPDAAGRLRRTGEVIRVEDMTGEVFHMSPPAEQLEGRLAAMCAFANGDPPEPFIHPAIRAIILHFWLAYDHPFVDSNGRTARALFYWAMLRANYWLFEYISISAPLKRSPGRYYKAFLHTETDENDLTYFIIHQADVIRESIANLHAYIDRKTQEVRESEGMLRGGNYNHRQLALISHALRHPGAVYTVAGHQESHLTANETARKDILGLVAGFVDQGQTGPGDGVPCAS